MRKTSSRLRSFPVSFTGRRFNSRWRDLRSCSPRAGRCQSFRQARNSTYSFFFRTGLAVPWISAAALFRVLLALARGCFARAASRLPVMDLPVRSAVLPERAVWAKNRMRVGSGQESRLGLVLGLLLTSSTVWASEFYVSPAGTSSGNGTERHPWNLATALKHPSIVKPGDTIWLRGGRMSAGTRAIFPARRASRSWCGHIRESGRRSTAVQRARRDAHARGGTTPGTETSRSIRHRR